MNTIAYNYSSMKGVSARNTLKIYNYSSIYWDYFNQSNLTTVNTHVTSFALIAVTNYCFVRYSFIWSNCHTLYITRHYIPHHYIHYSFTATVVHSSNIHIPSNYTSILSPVGLRRKNRPIRRSTIAALYRCPCLIGSGQRYSTLISMTNPVKLCCLQIVKELDEIISLICCQLVAVVIAISLIIHSCAVWHGIRIQLTDHVTPVALFWVAFFWVVRALSLPFVG